MSEPVNAPTPKEIVLSTKKLIESQKFNKIEGVLRDAACGRCYLGLVTEVFIQEGLCNWKEINDANQDDVYIKDHQVGQAVISKDCNYILEITEKGYEAGLVMDNFYGLKFGALNLPTVLQLKPGRRTHISELNDKETEYSNHTQVLTWSDINDLHLKEISSTT
jgi:hypothetical protein